MAPHSATNLFSSGDKDEFAPERFSAVPSSGLNGAPEAVNGTANGSWKPSSSSSLPRQHAETGISVLIVGAGMGGLMTAMECWRKGHNVVKILEKNEGPVYTGRDSLLVPRNPC